MTTERKFQKWYNIQATVNLKFLKNYKVFLSDPKLGIIEI